MDHFKIIMGLEAKATRTCFEASFLMESVSGAHERDKKVVAPLSYSFVAMNK